MRTSTSTSRCTRSRSQFNDLESVQHAVLEVLTFRVGSATPDTIMAELCDALPMLRLLVVFDGRWADTQESVRMPLCITLLGMSSLFC